MIRTKYIRTNFSRVFFIAIALYLCSISSAQINENKIPALGKHEFVPYSYIESPFINTHLQVYTGAGNTQDIQFTLIEINDEYELNLNGDVTFLDMGFRYQQRVREWMAMYIKYGFAVRVGSEVQSIIFQGLNTVTSFEIGWNIKVSEGDKYMLTSNMNMQNHSGSFNSILGLIRSIADSLPNSSLTKNVPVLVGSIGLRYAYAAGDVIGLRVEGDLSYGETYDRTGYGIRTALNIAVDFNFKNKYDVPLGLAAGYGLTSQPEVVYVDNKYAHILSWKIAYTGSPDFGLGIEANYIKIPLPELETKPGIVSFALNAKYFF